MPSRTPQPDRGRGNARPQHTERDDRDEELDELEYDDDLEDDEDWDDEDVVAAPRKSRGPLVLLTLGALLAVFIAGAQFLRLPIPGLEYLPGGRNTAAASGKPAIDPSAPVLHDLASFRKKYGDPKQANYGRIQIPSLGIDAPIGKSVVGKNGTLADPEGPSDVVWYDFGARKDLGGAPGAGGNAVLAGHVDRAGFVEYAGANYSGPGVFFSLDQVTQGDVVDITVNDKTLRYGIVWAKQVPTDTDWNQLFSSKVLGDSITIVTCGGDFDYDKHEYVHRLVVRAVRG
ncbi:MAG: class F sortase [Chloroflexi bacterium]|nr:MAG: class F sortase [Chloroflexota bacterium]